MQSNDLTQKYIDLIHKRQRMAQAGKDVKRYYIVIDELIALIASANKTADTLEQQLETIAVIGRSNVSLILITKIGM